MLRWSELRGHPLTHAAVYTPPPDLDGLRPQTVALAFAALLLPPLLLLGKKTGGPATLGATTFGAASGLWMGFLLKGGVRGPLAGLLRALARFNAASYAQERGARWAALRSIPAHDWVCPACLAHRAAPPDEGHRGALGRGRARG